MKGMHIDSHEQLQGFPASMPLVVKLKENHNLQCSQQFYELDFHLRYFRDAHPHNIQVFCKIFFNTIKITE
jgi:hypothetical protein